MLRIMCKSKIHRARITKVDLHYEGSIGIDKTLLKKADVYAGEIVQVVNINKNMLWPLVVVRVINGRAFMLLP